MLAWLLIKCQPWRYTKLQADLLETRCRLDLYFSNTRRVLGALFLMLGRELSFSGWSVEAGILSCFQGPLLALVAATCRGMLRIHSHRCGLRRNTQAQLKATLNSLSEPQRLAQFAGALTEYSASKLTCPDVKVLVAVIFAMHASLIVSSRVDVSVFALAATVTVKSPRISERYVLHA